jgi:hypothetical protein
MAPERRAHRRTECQVGCEDRRSVLPSKVDAENANAQSLDHGTDEETDAHSGPVGKSSRLPGWSYRMEADPA